MKDASVIMVNGESGDWSGLYVGGILECEGHGIYADNWIDLIRKYKCFNSVEIIEVTDTYLHARGNLPEKLVDIPTHAIL